jgi:hypothetical protein
MSLNAVGRRRVRAFRGGLTNAASPDTTESDMLSTRAMVRSARVSG